MAYHSTHGEVFQVCKQVCITPYIPSIKSPLCLALTQTRQYRIHRPRCIRATRIPSVPVGKVPHRPNCLSTRQPFLHSPFPRPDSASTINTHPLFRPADCLPHCCRRRCAGRHRQPQTRRPPGPDSMDANPPNHPARLPGGWPDSRIPHLGFR